MAPFDRPHTSSYSPSVWHYLLSSAKYSDLLAENVKKIIPHLYLVPPQGEGWPGDPVGISWRCLMLVKLELSVKK